MYNVKVQSMSVKERTVYSDTDKELFSNPELYCYEMGTNVESIST